MHFIKFVSVRGVKTELKSFNALKRFRSITVDHVTEANLHLPCGLFFSFNRRFFNAESKSSFDLMGRTLGRIIFFGASVVVVVVELACSFSSNSPSSSTYS